MKINNDIYYFNFLRGYASLLVFIHHAAILGGGPLVFSGIIGPEAVNIFMFASGFLIYFQIKTNQLYEDLASRNGIVNFYLRRLFRIIPVYYILLIIAYFLANYLGEQRLIIEGYLPYTSTSMERYFITDLFKNFILHTSFLFGFLPNYAFSTPLPDWSLGLEIQFYLVFPIIYFLLRKHFLLFIITIVSFMILVKLMLIAVNINFPMPTFIALKFHIFASGIIIAHLYLTPFYTSVKKYILLVFILIAIISLEHSLIMPFIIIFSFLYLNNMKIEKIKVFNTVFKNKSSSFLADISYPLYLIHLIIMLPFFANYFDFIEVLHIQRNLFTWIIATLVLSMIVITLSVLIHKTIELPGINLGKRILKRKKIK